MNSIRLGIDLGGTKIEVVAMSPAGDILLRERVPNPGSYEPMMIAIRDLLDATTAKLGVDESSRGARLPFGIGIPGSIDDTTGLIKNANATWLNAMPFGVDLPRVTGRQVRVENDANCFALSEAIDGAASGRNIVFGVIIGSGMGGGLVVNRKLLSGRHHIAGEWGHIPLPWPRQEEFPMPRAASVETRDALSASCAVRLWRRHGKVKGPAARKASRKPQPPVTGKRRRPLIPMWTIWPARALSSSTFWIPTPSSSAAACPI